MGKFWYFILGIVKHKINTLAIITENEVHKLEKINENMISTNIKRDHEDKPRT
jgi:hypothetical protein